VVAEVGPGGEEAEDHELLEGVGSDEAHVHDVGGVGGDEVEREDGDEEEGNEAVDARVLVGGEDIPLLDRVVGQDCGHVQRGRRRHHMVEISQGDHLYLIKYKS